MSTENRPPYGARIERNARGSGPPSPEAVEERARELARIDGRSPEHVTRDDMQRALAELHDEALPVSGEDERSETVASSNPADMAVETGHEVTAAAPEDEQQLEEEEVQEGVKEAEHQRLLQGQARKGEKK